MRIVILSETKDLLVHDQQILRYAQDDKMESDDEIESDDELGSADKVKS